MTIALAKKAVDFLLENAKSENKIPSITFFGGEPTLLWNEIIVPTVNYAHHERNEKFNFSITSNCVLMTEERLQWMKLENVGLLFSIDGDKNTQDYNRCFHNGKGSFDAIRAMIKLVPQYFPHVLFRSTVIPKTCGQMFHNMQFASKSGFSSVYVIPNVFEDWSNENRGILGEQLRLYADYYIDSIQSGKPYIHLVPFEKAIGKISRIWSNDKHRGTKDCAAGGKCGFCTNGHGAIDSYGNIYGCQQLPTLKGEKDLFCLGDIFTGIDDSRRNRLVEAFDISSVSGSNCKDCSLNDICDGGCIANNYLIHGNLNLVPEMYCYWNQLLIKEALRVSNILGDAKNITFKEIFMKCARDGGYGL